MAIIRSSSNVLLKRVRSVAAGKEPDHVLLEGERLVDDALGARWPLDCVLVSEDRLDCARELTRRGYEPRVVESSLFQRLSRLRSAPGVLAVVRTPTDPGPSALPSDGKGLAVVAAGVADPGNLGAIARTAEAAGASVLIVLEGGASPWNDKALRGSMGSLLRLPVWRKRGSEHLAEQLSTRGYRNVRAATRGATPMDEFDWSGSVALWVCAETGSVPAGAEDFEAVSIPMAGAVESLNASVAAGVLLYSAVRSRREVGA